MDKKALLGLCQEFVGGSALNSIAEEQAIRPDIVGMRIYDALL